MNTILAAMTACLMASLAGLAEAQTQQEESGELDVTMRVLTDPDARLPDEIVRRIPLPAAPSPGQRGEPDANADQGQQTAQEASEAGREIAEQAREQAQEAAEQHRDAGRAIAEEARRNAGPPQPPPGPPVTPP